MKVSDEAFKTAYDTLRRGGFSWRRPRKTESPAEYIDKRDRAIHALCHILQSTNKSGGEK